MQHLFIAIQAKLVRESDGKRGREKETKSRREQAMKLAKREEKNEKDKEREIWTEI